jgi:hypothetical protein
VDLGTFVPSIPRLRNLAAARSARVIVVDRARSERAPIIRRVCVCVCVCVCVETGKGIIYESDVPGMETSRGSRVASAFLN